MTGLALFLQKCEVKFIAANGGGNPETFVWNEDIVAHLRRIGFGIKGICTGAYPEEPEWVETTAGISVCLEDGFISK